MHRGWLAGGVLLLSVGAGALGSGDAALARWRELDANAQTQVVALARRAFDAYVTGHRVIDVPARLPALLQTRTGVFVSTMRQGAPRCCMGTLFPVQPNAALEIIENAVAAAGHDRRFAPVKPRELRQLTLIVSIVGKPAPITADEAVRLDPTRDGLAVRKGDRYGVVLSGETAQIARMLRWARIRAGAKAADAVEFFRLEDVRFVEKTGVAK